MQVAVAKIEVACATSVYKALGSGHFVEADVRKAEDVARLIEALGQLDALVNNVGDYLWLLDAVRAIDQGRMDRALSRQPAPHFLYEQGGYSADKRGGMAAASSTSRLSRPSAASQ